MQSIYENSFSILSIARQRVNHTAELIYDRYNNNMQWTLSSKPSESRLKSFLSIFPSSSCVPKCSQSFVFIVYQQNQRIMENQMVLWVCRPIEE